MLHSHRIELLNTPIKQTYLSDIKHYNELLTLLEWTKKQLSRDRPMEFQIHDYQRVEVQIEWIGLLKVKMKHIIYTK